MNGSVYQAISCIAPLGFIPAEGDRKRLNVHGGVGGYVEPPDLMSHS